MTAVSLGDRPSGTIATVALRKTADMAITQFPEEVEIIKKSSYVDDIIGSSTSRESKYTVDNKEYRFNTSKG